MSEIMPMLLGPSEKTAGGTQKGRLGLCFCPGKKMKRGSEIKDRSMKADLARLRCGTLPPNTHTHGHTHTITHNS